MKTMLTLIVVVGLTQLALGCGAEEDLFDKTRAEAVEAARVAKMTESERLTYTVEDLEAAAMPTSGLTFTVESDAPKFSLTVPRMFKPQGLKQVTGNPNEAFFMHFTEVGSPSMNDDEWSPDSLNPEMAFIIYNHNEWPLKDIEGLAYVGDGTSVPVKIGKTEFRRFNAISMVPMVSYIAVKKPHIYQFVLKAYPAQFTDESHAQEINESMMSVLHSFDLN